jgi:ABC-type lipoprotein release transport system permease subunit
MVIWKIAFRNIFRQKRRSFFTALSMLGGFVLSAFFIGWADGTYHRIIDIFTRNRLGHIQIHEKDYLDRPSLYKTISDLEDIDKALSAVGGVDSWTPRLFSAGIASVGEKTTGVQIIGIEPEKETLTTNFDKKIIKGKNFSKAPSMEAVIGKGLAEVLKAEVNDEIVIVSQAADGSIANDLYKIIGISSTGDEITDRMSFYLHLQDAQELLVLEEKVHEIAVTVSRQGQVHRINNRIKEKLDNPGLSVEPWKVFARSFYIAMKADKEGMWIMILVMIIIVAVGVLNTVLMSVLERRREYGLLKAIGTKPKQVTKLVLAEINILALACVLVGIGAGLLINSYFASHGINVSSPVTYGGMKLQSFQTEVNLRSFLIPALTIFLSATLVGLFPALKAARTDPAKAMRIH